MNQEECKENRGMLQDRVEWERFGGDSYDDLLRRLAPGDLGLVGLISMQIGISRWDLEQKRREMRLR